MYKKDVIKYFGSAAEVARKLSITRMSVGQWPDRPKLVPELRARELHDITSGDLEYSRDLYKRLARKRKLAA